MYMIPLSPSSRGTCLESNPLGLLSSVIESGVRVVPKDSVWPQHHTATPLPLATRRGVFSYFRSWRSRTFVAIFSRNCAANPSPLLKAFW